MMDRLKNSAISCAVSLLSRRNHTERELSDKLAKRGYLRDEITSAVERLRERGYINDLAYGRDFAESLWETGKYGFMGVANQLRRRGLPEAIICEAMAELDREQETQYAIALLEHRANGIPNRGKAGRFLAARGFSYGVITRVLAQIGFEQ